MLDGDRSCSGRGREVKPPLKLPAYLFPYPNLDQTHSAKLTMSAAAAILIVSHSDIRGLVGGAFEFALFKLTCFARSPQGLLVREAFLIGHLRRLCKSRFGGSRGRLPKQEFISSDT